MLYSVEDEEKQLVGYADCSLELGGTHSWDDTLLVNSRPEVHS